MPSEPEQTVVLVTGANRGIGRGLAEAFLSRPNHTLIAAVRSDNTTLREYKPAKGSKLVLVKIDNASTSDPDQAVEQIKAQGIKSLDIVIANAGINPLDALLDVKDMDLEKLRHVWDVNTLSFISLFKAMYPLLKAAADEKKEIPPKLLAISSKSGQIVDMESNIPAKIGTYGVSKLALNYLVRRAHFENPWLTAWVMNPGFVQTDNGNATARLFGMGAAPHTLQQSITGLLGIIDGATRSVTSGNFYDFDGTQLAF